MCIQKEFLCLNSRFGNWAEDIVVENQSFVIGIRLKTEIFFEGYCEGEEVINPVRRIWQKVEVALIAL
jgi:hypothetical protein